MQHCQHPSPSLAQLSSHFYAKQKHKGSTPSVSSLMASLIFFLQNLLVFFLCSATPSFSFEPLNVEVVALITVRRSLIDPLGVLNNWDEDSVDPCSWALITCSSENLVIGLGAASQSLSGFLSGMIGNLTNLQQVLLQNNNITGEIPQELGLLPKLKTLDLSNNRFSGFVPESIGRLNSLQYLRLNNNSLSGAFPVSLSKIPHLAFLDLSYNNLSGPVPLFPARTFNVVGNPLICGSRSTMECSRTTAPGFLTFILHSPQENQTARRKAQKLAVALGSSFGAASLLVLSVVLFFWWRQKQKRRFFVGVNERTEDGSPSSTAELWNVRRFGLRELAAATENFSEKNVLGKGGFGVVYKGRLADGTVVAVKRLRDGGASGEAQFKTEVEMISLAVHRNLLRLIGYCSAAGERLLVYPFMPNGSVASRLRDKPALDWDARKRIAVGACRGLVYLHEQCDPKIIHRDVKAANVLLDGDCDAVVGDFGLARLLDHGESHVTTAVRGTAGHIAPEYLSTGQSSDKTDVFGFGILLLELVSGQRALELVVKGAHHQKGAVLDWVKKLHQERKLDILVDRDLGNGYDIIDVSEMVQVALLCTQYLPSNRPRMSEVMRMLEGDGLVEKWEASNRETRCSDNALGGANEGNDDNDNYGDGFSMEFVEEMELSGPR